MMRFWMAPLLALGASLVLCPDSDGSLLRRRCTVYVQPCQPLPPCAPFAYGGLARPIDKRLSTRKPKVSESTRT